MVLNRVERRELTGVEAASLWIDNLSLRPIDYVVPLPRLE
jgi:hypothetical protein